MSHKKLQLYTSRLMALLLCMTLILASIPSVYAADSGSCGDNLTWSFDGSILIIAGSGAMRDYSDDNPAPWDSYRTQILQLSLPDGLTRIGDRAFYACTNLMSVSIPGSVKHIGRAAFCKNTSLSMLSLHEGLETIGRSAFEECASLADLRVPASVKEIQTHAFYFCQSLTSASVPGANTTFGTGVFSYCQNLVRVDIGAPEEALPGWSFYGCDSLTEVNVQGNEIDASELKVTNQPTQFNPGQFTYPETEVDPPHQQEGTQPQDQQPSGDQQQSSDNTGHTNNNNTQSDSNAVTGTVVEKTDNSTLTSNITVTQTGGDNSVSMDISATVVNPEGWNEVLDKVGDAEEIKSVGDNTGPVEVTVYSPESNTVPKDVLLELAGKDVTLIVHTQSGSQFVLDCSQLDTDISGDLDLSYVLGPALEIPAELAGSPTYQLSFNHSSNQPAEVIIRLPGAYERRTASLYKNEGGKLTLLQSVIVDDEANTHWYLEQIDKEAEYLIALNVVTANAAQAYVPNSLHGEYKIIDQATGKEYKITGRSSSWGMGLGQVMGILAVVMISVIVVVGAVMFAWNKRRLKNGYVPDWDDDDDYE